MKVLVCGGREYDERKALGRELSAIHAECPIRLMIVGGAPGADRLAQSWAESNGIPVAVYPANWHRLGKRAGPVRNGNMLRFGEPDLVVAFAGGRGTLDMVRQANEAAVEVRLAAKWFDGANPLSSPSTPMDKGEE